MKIAKWYHNEDIRIEDVPTPIPNRDEMLVKVISCGICGSDVVEWYRLPRAPLVQGHEIGAQVVDLGKEITDYHPGDRVFIAPKVPCMACEYCEQGHYPVCPHVKERLPGGFAEYILVTKTLIEKGTYLLPDHISYDQSTFIEPVACAVRAQNLANIVKGQTILVMGCGMSGLLHIKIAKAKGCSVVATDINKNRLRLAEEAGADRVFYADDDVPDRLLRSHRKKADIVMISTSAQSAIHQAWQCVDKGGAVVFFAVPGPDKQVTIPINEFWTKEIRILTSYYCGPPDIKEAIGLIESGTVIVEDMITHRLPLSDIAKGFQLVIAGKESIKVIIKP
jgi:L-iditol 2-dehydrogenase